MRQRALSYYATNVWFVTRGALRRKPFQLWSALRDAALVKGVVRLGATRSPSPLAPYPYPCL